MRLIIDMFEGLLKTIMGMEPVKLDLIYPALSRPEVHKITNN